MNRVGPSIQEPGLQPQVSLCQAWWHLAWDFIGHNLPSVLFAALRCYHLPKLSHTCPVTGSEQHLENLLTLSRVSWQTDWSGSSCADLPAEVQKRQAGQLCPLLSPYRDAHSISDIGRQIRCTACDPCCMHLQLSNCTWNAFRPQLMWHITLMLLPRTSRLVSWQPHFYALAL